MLAMTLEKMSHEFRQMKLSTPYTSGGATTSVVAPIIDYPKPKEYDGRRDAADMENFLWQMEVYFDGINIVEAAMKVQTTSMYLSDIVALWWRRKHDEIARGACKFDTWDKFKREIKRQFYPENVVYEARKKLRELKHTRTIREYVKEFTTLMLQIPSTPDDDLLFYFLDGCATWVRQELQCRGVKTVDEAIAVAESLTKFEESLQAEAKTIKPAKGNFGGNKEDTRKAMQWSKPDWRQNSKGDYGPDGNTQAFLRKEYDEKKRSNFTQGLS
ncbi:uncharacterized protein LOC111367889 [Olea europaea var. sylvestris]|uniref:uncharacterized protein LOC111367889 n=1 Tax=Olea europaea var. sylvestris TaxID=158386 RepID=UPI000C1D35C0|nr:uncharacterized protein LOC111367889 [Olea europaea var. sylvestris]